jgi:hypothetical protein
MNIIKLILIASFQISVPSFILFYFKSSELYPPVNNNLKVPSYSFSKNVNYAPIQGIIYSYLLALIDTFIHYYYE